MLNWPRQGSCAGFWAAEFRPYFPGATGTTDGRRRFELARRGTSTDVEGVGGGKSANDALVGGQFVVQWRMIHVVGYADVIAGVAAARLIDPCALVRIEGRYRNARLSSNAKRVGKHIGIVEERVTALVEAFVRRCHADADTRIGIDADVREIEESIGVGNGDVALTADALADRSFVAG